ncbi:MAG: hypothetical protein IJV45_03255 [Prevotella sp.]|nr:hypothetical protein [Prevotella sp.]
MKRIALFIIIAAILTPVAADAQRKKKAAKPKPKPKVEEVVEEDPRIAQMLEATQKVVFIDSMVVSRSDFMSHIPLSPDCGRLAMTDGLGQFTNELGDKRLEAVLDSKKVPHIAVRDMMGFSWGDPVRVKGLGDDDSNFPYLMPDGTTLYFAQKGENSIGGYDLFVTRYDAENGHFLRPENLGMPFASEADDLFYAIDEQNRLGYFITTRRQPEGKACIYVFIPNESRQTYVTEAYTDEQMRSLAAIGRIADTWPKGNARKEAITRLEEARRAFKPATTATEGKMTELQALKHQADVLSKALQMARNNYARSTQAQKEKMSHEILSSEQELEDLLRLIKQKEKEERNKQYQ